MDDATADDLAVKNIGTHIKRVLDAKDVVRYQQLENVQHRKRYSVTATHDNLSDNPHDNVTVLQPGIMFSVSLDVTPFERHYSRY